MKMKAVTKSTTTNYLPVKVIIVITQATGTDLDVTLGAKTNKLIGGVTKHYTKIN